MSASNFGAYDDPPDEKVDPYALIAELSKALKAVVRIAEGRSGVTIYPRDARLVAADEALKKAKNVGA